MLWYQILSIRMPELTPSLYLRKENIVLNLKGNNKSEIIAELLDLLILNRDIESVHKEKMLGELIKREEKGSTGIGHQIAIPHCKSEMITSIKASMGIKPEGVDFSAIDGRRATIFILTLSPNDLAPSHIRFLASICDRFKDEKKRQEIIQARSIEEIYDFLLRPDEG